MYLGIKTLFLSCLSFCITAAGSRDSFQAVFSGPQNVAESHLPDVFRLESWIENGLEFVKEFGMTCMGRYVFTRDLSTQLIILDIRSSHQTLGLKYQLRATPVSPSICDPSVKQHSGYFDIATSSKGKQSVYYW